MKSKAHCEIFAPKWKRQYIDNCEAIRTDSKQFLKERVSKTEVDQMRSYSEGETDLCESDMEDLDKEKNWRENQMNS